MQTVEDFEDPKPVSIEDEKFHLIYPQLIRELVSTFWVTETGNYW